MCSQGFSEVISENYVNLGSIYKAALKLFCYLVPVGFVPVCAVCLTSVGLFQSQETRVTSK